LYPRFEFLSAVTLKIAAEWNVTQCSLVDRYQCFTGTCCPYSRGQDKAFSTLKMEAAGSSETMVTTYHITRCHIKRDNNPQKLNNFCYSREITGVIKSKEDELE
jgi:hypothetical protein